MGVNKPNYKLQRQSNLHSIQHQQGPRWDTMSRPLQTNKGESTEGTNFKE